MGQGEGGQEPAGGVVPWDWGWPSGTRVLLPHQVTALWALPSPALPSMGNTGLPGGQFPGTLGYSCPTQTALLCLQRKKTVAW